MIEPVLKLYRRLTVGREFNFLRLPVIEPVLKAAVHMANGLAATTSRSASRFRETKYG